MGGLEKWLKIAIFGEKTVTFSKHFRIKSIIFEWVIIAKIFHLMAEPSEKSVFSFSVHP